MSVARKNLKGAIGRWMRRWGCHEEVHWGPKPSEECNRREIPIDTRVLFPVKIIEEVD